MAKVSANKSIKIKASPKSVGSMFPERYMARYNGPATITEVNVVKSENKPAVNGCLAIHLRGTIITKNGNEKTVDIVDWYGKKKPDTPAQKFAEQMLNRAVNAQLSAGVEPFADEIEIKDARKKVLEIFKALVGKTVTISQYYKEGYDMPNINYRFSDDDVEEIDADDEVADEGDDDELPL